MNLMKKHRIVMMTPASTRKDKVGGEQGCLFDPGDSPFGQLRSKCEYETWICISHTCRLIKRDQKASVSRTHVWSYFSSALLVKMEGCRGPGGTSRSHVNHMITFCSFSCLANSDFLVEIVNISGNRRVILHFLEHLWNKFRCIIAVNSSQATFRNTCWPS